MCSVQSFQSLSCVQLFATPWTAARQASLSITSFRSLLKLMSIELVMPSNCLILCHPLLLPLSIFPSIRVFSNESTLRIKWPKYWGFSFNISLSNEHSGLISFRMDWLDLLAVQGTLKSLLQHHSSKASTLRCSAFFRVQLSHPYGLFVHNSTLILKLSGTPSYTVSAWCPHQHGQPDVNRHFPSLPWTLGSHAKKRWDTNLKPPYLPTLSRNPPF